MMRPDLHDPAYWPRKVRCEFTVKVVEKLQCGKFSLFIISFKLIVEVPNRLFFS